MIKTVIWTTLEDLSCRETLGSEVFLCLDPSLVAPVAINNNAIMATLRSWTPRVGDLGYHYVFEYDSTHVVGGADLKGTDIVGAICKDCLTSWVDGHPGFVEVDPLFSAWLATPPNISTFTNDTGYITSWGPETDPVFNAWLLATPPLYSEVDPVWAAWLSGPPNISEFSNNVGYITSWGPETDPVFNAWLLTSPLAGYVPYTGATADVDLGAWSITAASGELGTSGNTTTWDSSGHQEMTGTAKPWEDLRIEPTVRAAAGLGVPAFEKYFDDLAGTSKGVYLYSFTDEAVANNEKEIFFSMQMPHAWDGGSISMHVHFVPAATVNASDIIWGLEYAWKDIGEVFGDTTIVYSSTTLRPDDANITAGKHYIAEFAALAPGATADEISSILIGRLFRNSSSGSDTYTNKVGLLYIDAHYQLNSLGSDDEYVK